MTDGRTCAEIPFRRRRRSGRRRVLGGRVVRRESAPQEGEDLRCTLDVSSLAQCTLEIGNRFLHLSFVRYLRENGFVVGTCIFDATSQEKTEAEIRVRHDVVGSQSERGAWMPEQRLRRDEALHAFTAGAAWAEFAEGRRGCIREGFDADLTVFKRDVMTVHVDELPSVPVAATVVQGRVVFAGE